MSNFSEVLSIVASVAVVGATFFAALSAGISAWQTRRVRHATELSVMLDLSRRFDDVYVVRNKLLHESMDLSWATFDSTYQTLSEKLNSETWLMLRSYAGFMEFVGILVQIKDIDAGFLFGWMPVDPVLWNKVKALVVEMRKVFRDDLWVNWESLVGEHQKWK